MVSALMTLLREEKTFSQYELAERLHTSPEAVMAGIDFLDRAGYLKKTEMNTGCGKSCAGCHGKGSASCRGFVLWEAAEKAESPMRVRRIAEMNEKQLTEREG